MSSRGEPSGPTLELEQSLQKQGYRRIAGVDEVGRGSWAGPVVAAAVILPLERTEVLGALRDLKDSKQLTAEERSAAMEVIRAVAVAIGLGWSSHHVIDSLGIVAANRMAMVRAVRHLPIPPDALLVDHVSLRQCGLPQLYLSKADERSLSVAAASVVAKVVRDRWMTRCGARFPAYGFSQHKGYGTPAHRLALEVLGPSKVHRLSFQPVAAKVDAFS